MCHINYAYNLIDSSSIPEVPHVIENPHIHYIPIVYFNPQDPHPQNGVIYIIFYTLLDIFF